MLDWHVVNEPFVDMLEQLLGAKSFVLLDLPQVSLSVKVTAVAFGLHLTQGEEWDRLKVVLVEDAPDVLLTTVEDDAEENRQIQVCLMLIVRISGTDKFFVYFRTLVTASLDCEKIDHVVWAWVLDHKLPIV